MLSRSDSISAIQKVSLQLVMLTSVVVRDCLAASLAKATWGGGARGWSKCTDISKTCMKASFSIKTAGTEDQFLKIQVLYHTDAEAPKKSK